MSLTEAEKQVFRRDISESYSKAEDLIKRFQYHTVNKPTGGVYYQAVSELFEVGKCLSNIIQGVDVDNNLQKALYRTLSAEELLYDYLIAIFLDEIKSFQKDYQSIDFDKEKGYENYKERFREIQEIKENLRVHREDECPLPNLRDKIKWRNGRLKSMKDDYETLRKFCSDSIVDRDALNKKVKAQRCSRMCYIIVGLFGTGGIIWKILDYFLK